MKADYHVHSSFSDDSDYPMEEIVKRGIKLRLDELCFTEHIDYGVKTDSNCDMIAYKEEFNRLKRLYNDKIILKFGIEFGIQKEYIKEFKETFDEYPFDFVILSCHQVDNKEFWTQEFQKGKSQMEYNEKYYEEILQVIKLYKDYSVLGHLDSINRYDNEGKYPFHKVKDIVTEILKQAIYDGKGIEVNTSCFRYGLKDLTPSREILMLYKELGGEVITIGSDSHKENHLGFAIEEVKNTIKEIGFSKIYTFEKMKPLTHDLSGK